MATTTTTAPELSRAQLVEIVRTGTPLEGVSSMRAVSALGRRTRKDYTDVLVEVVTDNAKPARLRHVAALEIYKLGGRQGEDALVEAARRADAGPAPALALGLGRIGGPDRMAVIERLVTTTPRHARPGAEFAATLLAFRHHLDDYDVRPPPARAMQDLGRKAAKPIEVANARKPDLDRAFAALDSEPLDVALRRDGAWRIDCAPNTFVWVWSEDAAGGSITRLSEGKCVAGVLFRHHPIETTYSLSAIALASPTRAGVRLTVHRASTGRVLYVSTIDLDGKAELRARDHPGLAAVEFRGRLGDAGTEVSVSKSAVRPREARIPKRMPK